MTELEKSMADREYRTSDTLLVRIAERPLAVAAIFFLTAIFPWVVYFYAPALAEAFQSTSYTDLIQWLSLPVLFLLVNCVVFFLWINHSKSSSGSGSGIARAPSSIAGESLIGNSEDWGSVFDAHRQVKKDESSTTVADNPKARESDPSFSSSSESEREEEEERREVDELRRKLELPAREEQEPQVKKRPAKKISSKLEEERDHQPPAKKISSKLEEERDQPAPSPTASRKKSARNEQLESIDEQRVSRPRHKKTQSLKLDAKMLEEIHAAADKEHQEQQQQQQQKQTQAQTHRVTRRNSSPKSRTPTPSSFGLEMDPKHVTRRNSSPKTMTPTASSSISTPSLANIGTYIPPSRPVPLDRDDLNTRIDSFLTKFKIERQESNLRAALLSDDQKNR
ncbi:histone H3.v1-like isoform X2 [Selaginella moellendorffii]|uniref:histone H3.v1-like isoform X2 n=1 Tax=Selaginella moellendorffii TaxID=88036 RepID=UPI000D1C91E0|nr:histone H3.v1-like isoform X2 [Selaginella moellendorffii]|eukprot:XP_024515605.1 histone H3.v1-like isoform X2 [Selaginella moellendorffii]